MSGWQQSPPGGHVPGLSPGRGGPTGYDPAAPPSKKTAGWALGLSLVTCVPLCLVAAVVLSIVVLRRSRDGQEHGRPLAIVALCIGSGSLLVWGALLLVNVVGDDAERDSSGQVSSDGDIAAVDLQVGDCFKVPDGTATREVAGVPCTQTHDAEVYGEFGLPGKRFPGDTKVGELADDGCIDRFKAFVGLTYEDSVLDVFMLNPTKLSWALGDKVVTCAVYEPAGPETEDVKPLTGTLRDAMR